LKKRTSRRPTLIWLDALPMGEVRVELRHHKSANQIKCTATLLGPTVPAARQAAHEAIILPFDRSKRLDQRKRDNQNEEVAMPNIFPVPILGALPAGAPKDGTWTDQRFSVGRLVVAAEFVLLSLRRRSGFRRSAGSSG
jgi:hypothetical protein